VEDAEHDDHRLLRLLLNPKQNNVPPAPPVASNMKSEQSDADVGPRFDPNKVRPIFQSLECQEERFCIGSGLYVAKKVRASCYDLFDIGSSRCRKP
jgi:hypothetical protein